MKKITIILAISFLIIIICMISLVRSGVGLRTAPLIKPTVFQADEKKVAHDVVLRLFPEFQTAHYVLWGLLPETPESERLFSLIAEEFQKAFPEAVKVIRNVETITDEELAQCTRPCWLMIAKDKANELTPNEFIEKRLRPLGKPYFNMNVMHFDRHVEVSEVCDKEKRLTLDCMTPVSVREVSRKIKKPDERYFFLRKYNDNDYFLFLEKEKAP